MIKGSEFLKNLLCSVYTLNTGNTGHPAANTGWQQFARVRHKKTGPFKALSLLIHAKNVLLIHPLFLQWQAYQLQSPQRFLQHQQLSFYHHRHGVFSSPAQHPQLFQHPYRIFR
jgi:hypothetical protein